ncbi:MAG: MBL fold metallo-hydrolase [Endomicrobiaceae bacterium]|nr:MBL fold metallo-hydrolase [Endomicrobiaceae bacterium]
MKLTILAEGSTKWQRFIRRWGVSFLLDDEILFDAFGRTDIFKQNLDKFNVDIQQIKTVILSHEHWDHVNGFKYLLTSQKEMTVYVPEGFSKKIKESISSPKIKLIETNKITEIKKNIFISETLCGYLHGHEICEQSLVVKTDKGLSVICGCAHPGIDNIVKKIQTDFKENVYSLIGGFHLKDSADEVNSHIIKNLQEAGVKRIIPMHCTGKRAVETIHQVFGSGFIQTQEGDVIEL